MRWGPDSHVPGGSARESQPARLRRHPYASEQPLPTANMAAAVQPRVAAVPVPPAGSAPSAVKVTADVSAEDKLARLLSYLDEIETSAAPEPVKDSLMDGTKIQVVLDGPSPASEPLALATDAVEGLGTLLALQQQDLAEKDRAIADLGQQVAALQEAVQAKDQGLRRGKKGLDETQRAEYETTIQRHLSFIDTYVGKADVGRTGG